MRLQVDGNEFQPLDRRPSQRRSGGAAYETDTVTLDLLLDAQRRLAVAQSDYFRSLCDYAEGIRTVHYRKGSLLEYNNVYLAEGPWPGKAYFDARKLRRERDAGLQINYGFIQPNVFSRGPINQKIQDNDMINSNQNRGQACRRSRCPRVCRRPCPLRLRREGRIRRSYSPLVPAGKRQAECATDRFSTPRRRYRGQAAIICRTIGDKSAPIQSRGERGNGRRQAGGPRGDGADFLYDSCDGAGAAER